LAAAVAYVKRLGRLPIVVRDSPGFLVNRLLSPYLNESLQLLTEGIPAQELEDAAVAFGMSLGPLAMCDLIGIDTAFYAGRSLWDSFRDRLVVTPILPLLVKSGRLGRKSGLGFYRYVEGPDPPQFAPDLDQLLAPYVRSKRRLSREEVTRRLFLPMLVEATRALEERLVRDPRDVDLAVIFGLGFAASNGGLLYWADQVGAATILAMLEPLGDLGPRLTPTSLLHEMARAGGRFYPEEPQSCTHPFH
jgi:3-hydroxyacyl-CoA dehydrogenase/enoyl-CoA hydratase/3-hydroxybutyryl-CoA epimerase/3-hydroxyacyl-CoA dehydrogenase/enoyl-CoA hydratase/3-hydroxybutyryl-CoA epimerase/enoyl-CoA isomerase